MWHLVILVVSEALACDPAGLEMPCTAFVYAPLQNLIAGKCHQEKTEVQKS